MRPRLTAIKLCLLGLLIAPALAWQAAAATGAIWAVKVEGDAWLEGAAKTRIVKDASIPAGASIRTEANGNVVLLFQNGSTINIRPNSKFSIQEFSCESFDPSKVDYPSLKAEQGKSSRTRVSVQDGSIIANVRRLKGGSTFDIGTPLGTAGIRGTTVYAEVDMANAANPVAFGVADGSAVFTLNSGQSVPVNGGAAIGVSPQGQVTGPPANAGQMLSTAGQTGQTMSRSVPPPAPAATGTGGGDTGASSGGGEESTQSTGASAAAGGPVAVSSSGSVTVIRDGAQTEGANALNARLAPGTIIATGEDGTALIETSPGNTIRVQPNTQITIGETLMDRAVNENGDPIPQTAVTLATGTVVAEIPPGLGAVSPEVLALIRLPFAKTWATATPDDIRNAVLEAAKRNPDRAPEIVLAAIQSVRSTGRFPSSGAADVKQVVEDDGDGETTLEEMAAMIGAAATEGSPALAADIAQAVAGALRGGLSNATFVIVTPRGNVTPVVGGVTVVSSTGADPTTSTVTVASPSGSDLVVTTEGEQLPVDQGQVVILRPDGIEYAGITDFPNLPGVGTQGTTVPLPPVNLPPPDSPQPTPAPTPAPTPTPAPISP